MTNSGDKWAKVWEQFERVSIGTKGDFAYREKSGSSEIQTKRFACPMCFEKMESLKFMDPGKKTTLGTPYTCPSCNHKINDDNDKTKMADSGWAK